LASTGALLLNITNFGKEMLTSTKNYKLSWTTGQALIRYTQFLIQIHFINPFINAAIDVKPLGGRVGHLIFNAIFWSNSREWGSKYQSNVIKCPIVGHINLW
jgi:hypothetical protein